MVAIVARMVVGALAVIAAKQFTTKNTPVNA